MDNRVAIKMVNIKKTFGPVVANSGVNLEIRHGEVLALLGENGSGKTTLMNMLSGIYYPDEGEIFVDGKSVRISSPKDAFALGIGMIHQHFKLIDIFTAAENIVLGLRDEGRGGIRAAKERIRAICDLYGFDIDLEQKVYNMSVSQKQTLEIVKVLYRGANILILDEPTAVLTPQETEKLFNVIRNMKNDGKAVVIITHKLHEVLDISDRVAILRKGEYIATVPTCGATELSLTEMMVGKKVELNIERDEPVNSECRMSVSHLTVRRADGVEVLHDVSFDINSGEILGIAGISGCGQKELLETIAGLQRAEPGSHVEYFAPHGSDYAKDGKHAPVDGGASHELIGKTPKEIKRFGISLSFVPEDRLGMGLVGSMGMVDNMMLKNYSEGHSFLIENKTPAELADRIKRDLEVVAPDINTPVRRLSGGNVQKVLVGREISSAPTVLMTAYAVRGLDINTSYTIYHLLNEQKRRGVAVIYVGEDLDVLLELSDRILVLCGGYVNGLINGRGATKEQVGLLMTNLTKANRRSADKPEEKKGESDK